MEYNEKRIIVAFLIAAIAATVNTEKNDDTGEFDARCFGKPDGYSYGNPKNCAEFYHCTHGRSILKQCPETLYFDENQQVCDHKENVKCWVVDKDPDCENAENGTILPHPSDCTAFYMCSFSKAVLFKCDKYLMFDRVQNNCNWADMKTCPEAGK